MLFVCLVVCSIRFCIVGSLIFVVVSFVPGSPAWVLIRLPCDAVSICISMYFFAVLICYFCAADQFPFSLNTRVSAVPSVPPSSRAVDISLFSKT